MLGRIVVLFYLLGLQALADLPYFSVFRVEQVFDHDRNSFTEGITLADGALYESSGLWGYSAVMVRHLSRRNCVACVYVSVIQRCNKPVLPIVRHQYPASSPSPRHHFAGAAIGPHRR